jgi:hypothetical protein
LKPSFPFAGFQAFSQYLKVPVKFTFCPLSKIPPEHWPDDRRRPNQPHHTPLLQQPLGHIGLVIGLRFCIFCGIGSAHPSSSGGLWLGCTASFPDVLRSSMYPIIPMYPMSPHRAASCVKGTAYSRAFYHLPHKLSRLCFLGNVTLWSCSHPFASRCGKPHHEPSGTRGFCAKHGNVGVFARTSQLSFHYDKRICLRTLRSRVIPVGERYSGKGSQGARNADNPQLIRLLLRALIGSSTVAYPTITQTSNRWTKFNMWCRRGLLRSCQSPFIASGSRRQLHKRSLPRFDPLHARSRAGRKSRASLVGVR